MVKTNIKPPARAAPGAAGRQMGGGQEVLAEVSVFFTGAAALCNCLCLSVLHGWSFGAAEWAVSKARTGRSAEPGARYLFPFVRREGACGYRDYQNSLRRFNHLLRLLAGRYGLPDGLSSYSARHSWATLANNKNFQHELIRDAMGHSSVKVTETYFRHHTDEQIDGMNRELLTAICPV